MMMLKLFLIITLFSIANLRSNELIKFHSKTYNFDFMNVIESDGEFIVSGQIYLKTADYTESEILFLKFDKDNIDKNILFSKKFQDAPYDMIKDSVGNIFVLVWNEQSSSTAQNTTVLKFDKNGDFIKEYTFGLNDDEENTKIFIVNESLYIFGANHQGLFLLNLDLDLNYKWAKLYSFDKTYYQEAVTFYNDEFYILSIDRYFQNNMVFYKLDTNGNILKALNSKVNLTGYKNRTNRKMIIDNNSIYFQLTDFSGGLRAFIVLLDLDLKFKDSYEITYPSSLLHDFNIQNNKLILYNNFNGESYISYFNMNNFKKINSKKFIDANSLLSKHVISNNNEILMYKTYDTSIVAKFISDNNCIMKDANVNIGLQKFDNLISQFEVNGSSQLINYTTTNKYNLSSAEDLTIEYSNCATCGDGSEFDTKVSSTNKFKLDNVEISNNNNYVLTKEKDYFAYGAISHNDPVYVSAGFNTEFAFKIDKGYNDFEDGSLPGADGFTLLFHSNPLGSFKPDYLGGGMGYFNRSSSLAFEIDLYNNKEYNDPNGNHIALQKQVNGKIESIHSEKNTIAIDTNIIQMVSNGLHTYFCKLKYEGNVLSIWLDSNGTFLKPIFSIPNFEFQNYINLIENSKLYVSLMAVTGSSFQKQEIIYWNWCSAYDPISNVNLDKNFNEFVIYPNPSTDFIYIKNLSKNQLIEIYDLSGRLLISQIYKNDLLDISNLEVGMYMLKLDEKIYQIIKN